MDQQTFVQVKPMTDSPSPKICLHILQSALPTRNLLTTWSLSAPHELQFIRAALIFYVVTDVGFLCSSWRGAPLDGEQAVRCLNTIVVSSLSTNFLWVAGSLPHLSRRWAGE